ncbi:junctional cadherin 5-associated protein [Erinaceus europaeus]|uniref:Junctional cadherin 5-associated protein n=1 Tax=Erinaceus europaeus TaxID=9365 RepID=A0A1S3AKN0_ERIEU|nr:junctional cadherin 5-associated protein [Erinaceus europaeus]
MYGVEDLLVSHGYKLARDRSAPNLSGGQGRPRVRGATMGPGLQNGVEHGTATPGRRHGSTCESSPSLRGEHRGARKAGPREGSHRQPVLVWAWEPQPGLDQPYWRRQAPGLGTQQDVQSWSMAEAHGLPAATPGHPWPAGRRSEDTLWTEGALPTAPTNCPWPSGRSEEAPRTLWTEGALEGWDRRLARQVSPSDGESWPHALAAHSRGKSRSLPRVLAPESPGTVDTPPSLPGHSVPAPRPRFGKPLQPGGSPRPPSDTLAGPQPDPGPEPPLYVPPPSYHHSQPIRNPYLEEPAPPSPRQERGASPHPPLRVPRPPTASAVLYIPFDDPRVRHFPPARAPAAYLEPEPDAPCRPPPGPPPRGRQGHRGPREQQPQLRAFESGGRARRSARRKGETIFCLVSVPTRPEPQPACTDGDKHLRLGCGGQEGPAPQDPVPQTLVAGLAGRPESPGQRQGRPQLVVPVALRACPGQPRGDQQTQTSLGERPPLCSELTAQLPAGPEPWAHTALAAGGQRPRPGTHNLRGQMSLSLSGGSAFSRMSSAPGPPARPPGAPSPPPQAEVVKGQPTGPCNSQKLFGQFLLKPVSRRPWDLISQLESFNKELQGSGGSGRSSPADSQAKGSGGSGRSSPADSQAKGLGSSGGSSWAQAAELAMGRVVPTDPESYLDRVDTESASRCGEPRQGGPPALLVSPGSRQGNECGELPSSAGSLRPGKAGPARDWAGPPAVSPRPEKRTSASILSATPLGCPPSPPTQGEPWVRENPPAADPAQAELGPPGTLSLASRARGLSAPDLRSMSLAAGSEQGAGASSGPGGTAASLGVTPSESLQARAARILGIEVAVETLLPGGPRGPSPPPEEAREPAHRPAPSPAQPQAAPDPSYGRRRCGWTESPLFVGDRVSVRRGTPLPESQGVNMAAPGPEPWPCGPREPKASSQQVNATPACRSTLFHVLTRPPGDRWSRDASRAIDSLQERPACPPPRPAPGHLLRMREVSALSHCRQLGPHSSDSEDEEDPGDPARTSGCFSDVSRAAPLPAENGHPAAPRGRDVTHCWYPESYDPSRVEKV